MTQTTVAKVSTRGKSRYFRRDPFLVRKIRFLRPRPCRAPSTVPLTLTHLLTRVVVRLTTKVPLSPRHHKTNARLTINPHHPHGRASFPPQARAVEVTLPRTHFHTHRYPQISLRNVKLLRFRGWKGTSGYTLLNPSSSQLWLERIMTPRQKT